MVISCDGDTADIRQCVSVGCRSVEKRSIDRSQAEGRVIVFVSAAAVCVMLTPEITTLTFQAL